MINIDTAMLKLPTFHILVIFLCFLGIIIFLYGFFPIKYVSRERSSLNDLPRNVMDVRMDPKEFYFSRINPLIFIVIDALRWDFLTKSEHISNVPYITKLLNSGQACLFHAECSPPTVTMPRLKALMTGSVPNFVDIMLNLGSSQIKGDSLMTQAVDNNKTVVFYGDDTWLKMFPSTFLRSEGTTSFFVSDYEEVDLNVTRNIPKELAFTDWNIMILHYLGLDHIGHLAGPSSPLVGPKLREMDQVVETISEAFNETHKNWSSPMLILAGDHGMKNSGGHGGATTDEILSSLLFVQPGCSESEWFKQRIWQTDVTPTLAVLLGLPIPHNSIGTLILAVLSPLPPLHRMYALHYNAEHLKTMATPMNCLDHLSVKYLKEAEETFAHLLKLKKIDKRLYDRGVWQYETASHEMSQCLAHSDAGFHVVEMVSACCIFLAVIVTILINLLLGIKQATPPKSVLITAVTFMVSAAYFFELSTAYLVLIFTVTSTSYLIRLWMSPKTPVINLIEKIIKTSSSTTFLCVGCAFHAISLFGSSLVEEEHQTWYFLWTSLNLIKLFSISARILKQGTLERSLIKQAFLVIFLMVAHRFLRTLNQTGDKWADLPDTGDWLRKPENSMFHLLFVCGGLIGVWYSLCSLNVKNDKFSKVVFAAALTSVLLCRVANSEVELPFSYPNSKGVKEATCFWMLVLILSVHQVWQTRRFLQTFTTLLLLTLTLILRPHNFVVLPFLRFASRIIFDVYPSLFECTLVHAWIGSTAFFYQGNSNSLTTVDIAAGYVGAMDYNALRVGVLVFLHTFAGPVLSFLFLMIGVTQNKYLSKNIHISLQVFMVQKLVPLFVACFICVILRHHLFVWSVFAPKLLYEMTSSTAALLFVIPFWLMLSFQARQSRH